MEVVIVQKDGWIQLPDTLRERLGLYPGTRLAVTEGATGQALELHVLRDEVQLVELDAGIDAAQELFPQAHTAPLVPRIGLVEVLLYFRSEN